MEIQRGHRYLTHSVRRRQSRIPRGQEPAVREQFEYALAMLLVYVVVQQFENSFLVPRIIGRSVGIHPAILTVIVIATGYKFGLLGVILAAPLAAVARDLFIYAHRRLDGVSAEEARNRLLAPLPLSKKHIDKEIIKP